jgi:hypothetical protein
LNIYKLLIATVVNILLHIYAVHAWPEGAPEEEEAHKYTNANGGYMNGRTRNSDAQRIADAEGFELEGLMSDDEDEAGSSLRPKKTADEEMGAKEGSRS